MIVKSLAVAGAVSALVLGGGASAMASTDSATSIAGGTTAKAAATTVCTPGRHYCATFNYTPVSGGVILNSIHSVGFAVGTGCAREYVVVNGNYTRPTNTVCYNRNSRLTATHQIHAKAFCGTRVGVDWVGRNAPQGSPTVRVNC